MSLSIHSNKDSQLLRLASDDGLVERSFSDDKISILSIITKREEYKVKIEAISSPRRNSHHTGETKCMYHFSFELSLIFI